MGTDRPQPSPDDPRLEAWRVFLVAHARVTRQLERELETEQRLGLAEYDVLLQLAWAPERRLRMSELADRLVLSRSGATRLVDRLERDGLIAREACETDRRGAWAVLTDSGLARLRAASTTHLRGIEEHFLSSFSEQELDRLRRTLERLA
jgi:DNA-binding MarR family transcriptional regulator